MSGLLTRREQEDLLTILGLLYGSTSQFGSYAAAFNERTLEAVEELLVALKECNANIQKLLVGVVGAIALRGRGWLRRVLREVASELQKEYRVLESAPCRNTVRARGISPIITTAI